MIKSCPHCGDRVDSLYLDTHIKKAHPAKPFNESRPTAHFTGLVAKDHFVICNVCGWQMRKSILNRHQEFRHGARNSRSPAVGGSIVASQKSRSTETQPSRGSAVAIKAPAIPKSLQTHSGWKQAKTKES